MWCVTSAHDKGSFTLDQVSAISGVRQMLNEDVPKCSISAAFGSLGILIRTQCEEGITNITMKNGLPYFQVVKQTVILSVTQLHSIALK